MKLTFWRGVRVVYRPALLKLQGAIPREFESPPLRTAQQPSTVVVLINIDVFAFLHYTDPNGEMAEWFKAAVY